LCKVPPHAWPIARGFDTTNTLSVFNVRFEAPWATVSLGLKLTLADARISVARAYQRRRGLPESEEALRKKLII